MPIRVVLLLGLLAAQFAGADAAAQDDRQKLLEENLSLKVRNTALEADVLTLQDRINRVAAERDRALTDGERIQAELADIRAKTNEAAARLAELERQLEAARIALQTGEQALRESVAREQEAARRLAEQLAGTQAKADDQAATAPAPSPKPDVPPPAQPKPNAALQDLTNALSAIVAAYRSDKPAAAPKARLLRAVGTILSEAELEQALAGLVDKKSIASWTKYGNETVGLSYLLVTKVADNQFVGVVNLSFAKLLNGQPGALAEIEAIDKFFPVEIRSHDNWDETRVSWLYQDGDFLGALPHVPPLRAPWTIADYLKGRGAAGQAALILASGGRRDTVRPINLADLEKKAPEQFLRLAAASDATGYPKIYATMHMNSVILDPAVLTRGVDFQDFPGLRESAEAAFSASLGRTPRDKGIAAPLYGRLAALILMPDFAIQSVVAQADGARLAASYSDALGVRQAASVDFRKDAAGARWRPAALQR